jgi:hypothetical protein
MPLASTDIHHHLRRLLRESLAHRGTDEEQMIMQSGEQVESTIVDGSRNGTYRPSHDGSFFHAHEELVVS